MLGHRFSKYTPPPQSEKNDFERLLKVFMQLILITSGNVSEALQWLTEVDREYKLGSEDYGIGDFIEDLKRNGFISEEGPNGEFKLKPKGEQNLRQSALEEIFGKLKKTKAGDHKTPHNGRGDEPTTDRREYEFGDAIEQISMTDSLRNAQINHGVENFAMTEEDLEVIESEFKKQMVIIYLKLGFTNKEIAGRMNLSEYTVKEHLKRIMHKTKTTTRTGLVGRMIFPTPEEPSSAFFLER